ncbi:hypothetical protein D8674_013153 [Pyrus ussuriensis x Pyrus communis]|uniref:CAF1B/HIR1 beta-propeller domain-containing protein n=1 Tax=Pyrus ussuriensis x Pyrus communis TaxID=2448454 RepID=A0A5N5H2H0_9ROSA|nr:hypothetical protein D8674_013153 [Pyrus ussuriensis x Pyrus communis]
MKGGNVQINWHDNKPVLTLDFHPIPRTLATGGADLDIKLWSISWSETEKKLPVASYQKSLSYYSSAVNVVHFSHSGEQLVASADGDLIVWKLHDVLDLQWSIDGAYLISGSVDNSCIIWDVNKGSVHQILDSHCHYVQGMAWDPLVNYVASLSSDKTFRIYVKKPQYFAKNHLFLDETLPSFFRRLAWSPHGSFLLVPAGSYKVSPTTEIVNTAYVFSRNDLSRQGIHIPAVQLLGAYKAVIAVHFHPLLFSLRGSNQSGFFNLPHCIIFVVATLNSLYIYETESAPPIATFAGFHYAAITDIAWSPDAHCLALSSQDGYCTLIEFENDELGSPIYLTEEKKVAGDEKRSPVHKPEDMVLEAAKNNSLVEKAENVPTEAMAANNLITTDSAKSKAEWNQLTEAETKGKEVGGEENESPVEKLDDMVLDSIVAEKIGKSEAERNEGQQSLGNCFLIPSKNVFTDEKLPLDWKSDMRIFRVELYRVVDPTADI